MPTNRPLPRPRRHSLSSGDESFHPHPAKAGDLPRPDSRRRARLPRSKSTSNVSDALSRARCTADNDTSNVALEQVDISALRELASVLRTTGPPPDRRPTHDDCLRLSGTGDPRRWSLQSLRRNKRIKPQRNSLQSHLPENIVPGTTTEGYRYNAISTPIPKKNNLDGPWFRSQYPVFLPSPQSPPRHHLSSPGIWPERSSSKSVHFSNTEKRTGDPESSSHRRSRPIDKDNSRSMRVSTDLLLRAMLNPVDEGIEHDIGTSLTTLCSQRGLEDGEMQALPRVTMDEDKIHELNGPERATSSDIVIGTESLLVKTPRESPHASSEGKGPPYPPPRSSRRLANINVQPGLAVPNEEMAPESPGFPNMLATLTFPCPPKGSRPSSPASPNSTAPSIAESLKVRPIVQPRTSSRHATSISAPAASLNEIVMQKRPGSRQVVTDRPTDTEPAEHPTSVDVVHGQGPNNEISSLRQPHEKIVASPCGGVGKCQRESLASQLTATTKSSRQSTLTYSSSRSSTASEVSTQSKTTIVAQKTETESTQTSQLIEPPTSERCTNAKDRESKTTFASEDDVGPTEIDNPDLYERQSDFERSDSGLSSTSNSNIEANSQPKSIIERRLARKAKVREYKMRDLSRADTIDSPVLGYFPAALPGPSTSFHSSRRPSTLSVATTISEASNETPQNIDITSHTDLTRELPLQERSSTETTTRASRTMSAQLTMSAVNATEIEPIYPPTPHWHTSGITMSPIMIVADVESRPGSPTLRFSTLARPEQSSPRVRLKPLKISPHSRQKSLSVTISRNPTTGAIERSSSVPIDTRFNRRSLMIMPTPPMSPEVSQASKRLSLPPVPFNLPVTPRERTPPSRCQEWQSSQTTEQGIEGSLRSTTLKERVMREKLQKEKEITDIVAKTVGPPQKQAVDSDELGPLSLEQNNTESLEKRLKRLERNNDAWLSAMKPLLEAMARTLDDMRVDEKSSSLRMSDFVIDMEAEARRVSHSRRGEKEYPSTAWQHLNKLEPKGSRTRDALGTSGSTPLSPVPQELDDSPTVDSGAVPVPSTVVASLDKAGEPGDWSDLDPLIRELSKPRKSRELQEASGSYKSNALSPLMRELMNASELCTEEVTDVR
ncbi:hypothetical protein F5B22DRAFT_606837 [Xylaria bambusicola]|uniref:uncharacterized protein n=1 Tax=Xylaria bambusicola TaxID=326684 RepID=UPI0020076DF5|nr:uncharacterized protein F5B22DRAFT_606837 [Xylaria bambusicola]KAI0515335.1 hypothetical protein F5B22DRAFT_606837 [Xylaria bambusicola]